MALAIIWGDLNGLAKMKNRLLNLSLPGQEDSQIMMRFGMAWFEFVMSHLPKGCKGDQDEEETNKEFQERRGGQKGFCLKRMVPIGRCQCADVSESLGFAIPKIGTLP